MDHDYVVTVLLDDFCNADDPAPWLGKSVAVKAEAALAAAQRGGDGRP
jgi:hypothetical protein